MPLELLRTSMVFRLGRQCVRKDDRLPGPGIFDGADNATTRR